jgi:hypothetical protein
MPRTLFFHELSSTTSAGSRVQWRVKPIDISSSPLAFSIKDAKEHKDFKLTPCVLPDDLFFDVLTSNLLTQFEIASPLKALLPIHKDAEGKWSPLQQAAIAAKGNAAASAFRQICRKTGSDSDIETIWELLNMRNKLALQVIRPDGYIVLVGTSGSYVCAAFAETREFDYIKLIIDQTLNWAQVDSEDEAIYLTGLFNSEAINHVIQDFQPEGAFGKRHIHSLPFGVTPPYDETQTAHQEVAMQTRRLLADYEIAKASDAALQRALQPNLGTLARRRSVVREKLKGLPSFNDYANACRALYDV